jgi:hypothetical protein
MRKRNAALCNSAILQDIILKNSNTYIKTPLLKHRPRTYAMMEWYTRMEAEHQAGRTHRVDFVAVVEQAIALLRQRGRLTYRTLQLQLQLDDAHLAALTDELIKGQRLAVDEADRVLVWRGASGATASPAAPSSSESRPGCPRLCGHATAPR